MKPNAQVWLIGHSAGSHLCAMLLSSPWYDGLPTAARKVFVFCMWSYQKIRTSMSARRRVIYTPEEFFWLSSRPGDSWRCFLFQVIAGVVHLAGVFQLAPLLQTSVAVPSLNLTRWEDYQLHLQECTNESCFISDLILANLTVYLITLSVPDKDNKWNMVYIENPASSPQWGKPRGLQVPSHCRGQASRLLPAHISPPTHPFPHSSPN